MEKKKTKPTLDEIAAHSGVSAATVSRVLSRSGSVSRALVDKVKNSLKVLGVEQHKSGFIAFLTPIDANPLDVAVNGVLSEAEKLKYTVIPLHMCDDDDINNRNCQLLKMIDFDAVIILKHNIDPVRIREQYQLGDIPIIMIAQRVEAPDIHCIDTNRDIGMYKAVKYLLGLGHTHIAYLSETLESDPAQARKAGIDRAMHEAGLQECCFTFRQGTPSIENGFQMTGSLINSSDANKPTAIVTYNDMVAIGCLHALNTYGVRIPEDISVLGFDDIYITPHTNPPLTTVHQPKERMGRLAVTKIDNLLSGRDQEPGGLTLLECPLIVRESTGPARKN